MYDELAFKVLQDSMRDKPESNTFRSAPFPERCSVGHQALVALAAAKVDYPDNGWSDVEYYALASVYVALQGSDWTHRGGWLQPGVGPCTWAGIECNEYDNVASLDLKSNRAEGKIPYQIGLLASLSEFIPVAAIRIQSFRVFKPPDTHTTSPPSTSVSNVFLAIHIKKNTWILAPTNCPGPSRKTSNT